jgi:hypothetical protein
VSPRPQFPLYPPKRTSLRAIAMSALCQTRTFRTATTCASKIGVTGRNSIISSDEGPR